MIKKHGIKYSVRRYANLEKGFTRLPNDIFKIVESSYQLTIYTYLCYRYNKDYQYAFPSLRTIAEDTHVSLSTVRRVIKELEDLRLIKILKSNEDTQNIYDVFYFEDEENKIEEDNHTLKYILTEEDMNSIEEIENNVYNKITERNEIKRNNKNNRNNYDNTKWRNDVLERDGYACQLCGCCDDNIILHVHHIKKHSNYKHLRTDIDNGITLCKKCHSKVTNHEEEYEDMFIEMIIKKILNKFGK